jgi:hypothetical protein
MIRSDNLLSRPLFQTKMPHQLNNTMKGLLALRIYQPKAATNEAIGMGDARAFPKKSFTSQG